MSTPETITTPPAKPRTIAPFPHRYTVRLSGGPRGYAEAAVDGVPSLTTAPPPDFDGLRSVRRFCDIWFFGFEQRLESYSRATGIPIGPDFEGRLAQRDSLAALRQRARLDVAGDRLDRWAVHDRRRQFADLARCGIRPGRDRADVPMGS